jgi:hypothetical protein
MMKMRKGSSFDWSRSWDLTPLMPVVWRNPGQQPGTSHAMTSTPKVQRALSQAAQSGSRSGVPNNQLRKIAKERLVAL